MPLHRLNQAIDAYGKDKHEMDMPTIHSVLFAAITVKQFVSLEIPGYVTTIFKIAQKMVMPDEVKKTLQDMTEKVQQLKDKHVELFFSPVTELKGDELDLMKKWASSHWETDLMHDPGPAPLKSVQVS